MGYGASEGGGIKTYSGNVYLSNSALIGNNAAGNDSNGGGVFTESGSVSLTNSTVSENTAVGYGSNGGGIFSDSGTISLNSSTISENLIVGFGDNNGIEGSSDGGGIFTNSGSISLINSTLSENSSAANYGNGGGLWSGDSSILIVNSTITGNSAGGEGGGLNFSTSNSSLTIHNSIIADNRGTSSTDVVGPDLFARDEVSSGLIVENSLIGDITASGITAMTGSGNILNQSPQLLPLANNGGPTETHALISGSPAVDAGSDALAAGLIEDQRGLIRIANERVDIGAFELQGPRVASVVRDEGGVLVRPDLLTIFAVTFDQNVNVAASDLSVINNSFGGVIDISGVDFSYDFSTATATWDFRSLPNLEASFYTFELSDAITSLNGEQALDGDGDDTSGGNYVDQIYVAIPGDANLDGDVEVNEINLFMGTNTGDGATVLSNLDRAGTFGWSDGDFNGDGDVDSYAAEPSSPVSKTETMQYSWRTSVEMFGLARFATCRFSTVKFSIIKSSAGHRST